MIKSSRRYLVILLIAGTLLFVLDAAGIFSFFFESFNKFLVGPIVSASTTVFDTSFSFFSTLFSVRSLVKDFDSVKNERDLYRGQYFELRAIEEENQFLRQALGQEAGPGQSKLVLADVITFDPLRPNQIATLNKGSTNGIRAGQAVIMPGNVLIGRIQRTQETTSQVLLITSEESRIAATLEGSKSNAIIIGSPSGALLLDLILKDVQISNEEIVLTSGLGGDLPSNLLIGRVSKIVEKETASFNQAIVRPFFEPRDVRQVFVISSL